MKLNPQQLTRFVDAKYFNRGKEYFNDGLIKIITRSSSKVTAKVAGTTVYSVILCLAGDVLGGTCTCPAFTDYGPCKHVAAVGLAVMTTPSGVYELDVYAAERIEEFDDFEKALNRKTKAELIEFIIDLTASYPEIIEDLPL